MWHNQRRSILTSCQHLLNEAESILLELPLELREQLPDPLALTYYFTLHGDRIARRVSRAVLRA